MRRLAPLLVVVIGLAALFIDVWPGLTIPDPSSPTGSHPIETRLGLDLSGGIRVEYQAQPVGTAVPTKDDMDVVRGIVERRVNTTGVVEPVITTGGTDRIIVELPGATDPAAVRRLVGQTGRLDFVPLGTIAAAEGQPLDLEQVRPLFGGSEVASAVVGTDALGRPTVDFTLKGSGAKLFADYSSGHVGTRFAIVLDGTIISAPVIAGGIPNGQVQITGGGSTGFSAQEASALVSILRFGALPFPLKEVSFEQIGATLGH